MDLNLLEYLPWMQHNPLLHTLTGLSLLLMAAWVANWLVKRVLLVSLHRMVNATDFGREARLADYRIIRRLANVVPALLIDGGSHLVPGLSEDVLRLIHNVSNAFIVLCVALALSALLNFLNALYQRRPDAARRPIKGYMQLLKLLLFAVATIMIVASLTDRSPLILLSGLGAMAAVLMLIFQDTLLSMVASLQISTNDIIRVGDWVEMPQLNADGEVIDVALHTIKVQNWDKTITSIPTRRFITDSFKNWRGMQESGGRRICRSLRLDQNSVRFLTEAEVEHLAGFNLLREHLGSKQIELAEWNSHLQDCSELNLRHLTNLGTFRAYVLQYLRRHPHIRQDTTLLVRQQPPSAEGLGLELYCFTNTTVWADYEGIQGDIFEHLLATLPAFGLRVFQHPTGADFRQWQQG